MVLPTDQIPWQHFQGLWMFLLFHPGNMDPESCWSGFYRHLRTWLLVNHIGTRRINSVLLIYKDKKKKKKEWGRKEKESELIIHACTKIVYMVGYSIDSMWSWDLKEGFKPFSVVKTSRAQHPRLCLAIWVQLLHYFFKLNNIFSILVSLQSCRYPRCTQLISWQIIRTWN